MARRSSSSSRSRSSFSSPSQRSSTVPQRRPAADPVVARRSNGGGGFISNMAGAVSSGISHGIGFGIAQRAIDSVMGPRKMEVSHINDQVPSQQSTQPAIPVAPQNSCKNYLDELNQCFSQNSDISLCQHHMDALKSCQTGLL